MQHSREEKEAVAHAEQAQHAHDIIRPTLQSEVERGTVSRDDIFNEDTQDRLRVHDMLERIERVRLGTQSKADLAELDRWGISRRDAERIAMEPIEEIEGGGRLANTDAWGDEELVRKFRSAIRQGNENTVLLATAADKPIIMDGTFYVRSGPRVDAYAKRLGLTNEGQYWRGQSGLLTLPFAYSHANW